jgi:hypothetical protein
MWPVSGGLGRLGHPFTTRPYVASVRYSAGQPPFESVPSHLSRGGSSRTRGMNRSLWGAQPPCTPARSWGCGDAGKESVGMRADPGFQGFQPVVKHSDRASRLSSLLVKWGKQGREAKGETSPAPRGASPARSPHCLSPSPRRPGDAGCERWMRPPLPPDRPHRTRPVRWAAMPGIDRDVYPKQCHRQPVTFLSLARGFGPFCDGCDGLPIQPVTPVTPVTHLVSPVQQPNQPVTERGATRHNIVTGSSALRQVV